MRLWTARLAALMVGIWASTAAAQRGPVTVSSLALDVDRAEVVVRGTIGNVTTEPAARPNGQWLVLTVNVSEKLKGDPGKTVTWAQDSAAARFYERAKAEGTEFLWCLEKNTKFQVDPAGADSRYPWTRVSMEVPLTEAPKALGVYYPKGYFGADLGVVSKAEEILAAARAEAKRQVKPGKVESAKIGVARGYFEKAHSAGDGLLQYVLVPRDERLETLARRIIDAPEEFGAPRMPAPRQVATMTAEQVAKAKKAVEIDQDLVRVEGVQALAGFKSEANIALLKPMLKNDSTMIISHVNGDWPPKTVYFIRQAAYEVLKGWGVAVEEPVMEVKRE